MAVFGGTAGLDPGRLRRPGCRPAAVTPDSLFALETLLAPATTVAPQVSPDGRWISFLRPVDGAMNLFVAPIDTLSAARPVAIAVKERGPCTPDLYRLDLTTGQRTLILRNDAMVAVIPDGTLAPRLGIGFSPDGSLDFDRPMPAGQWQLIWDVSPEDVVAINSTAYQKVFAFDGDNRRLYLYDTEGRDAAVLTALDPETGRREIVFADKRGRELWWVRRSGRPVESREVHAALERRSDVEGGRRSADRGGTEASPRPLADQLCRGHQASGPDRAGIERLPGSQVPIGHGGRGDEGCRCAGCLRRLSGRGSWPDAPGQQLLVLADRRAVSGPVPGRAAPDTTHR